MKFLKLHIINFKPYYQKGGKPVEISLFNEERKDKNLTLNVGPNDHGKTSISDAIMWCLYGDVMGNWEQWVNDLVSRQFNHVT